LDLESTSTDLTTKEESSSTQETPKSSTSIFTPTSNSLVEKLMSQSGQNKSKNRLGLKLRIPEEKDMKEEKK